jgi:hypothetical protein
MVNLDRESVQHLLIDELNIKRVCARMVLKMPSAEQKEL